MSVGGIKTSHRVEIIKFPIPGEQIDLLSEILDALGDKEINIWFVGQVRTRDDVVNITLCVDPEMVNAAVAVISKGYPDIQLAPAADGSILSVFPYRDSPETAFHFFNALGEAEVPVLAMSTSLSSLSCLVPHDQSTVAQEALQKAFQLQKPTPST